MTKHEKLVDATDVWLDNLPGRDAGAGPSHRHRDRLNRVWLWASNGNSFIGFRKENING